MKESIDEQGVGATAFDLPNDQNPWPYKRAYHTNMRVPKPTNESAKKVDHAKIMRQVTEGR